MNELERLKFGAADERPEGFIIETIALCEGNAASVLNKTKEVLTLVLENSNLYDAALSEWNALLPHWFLDACSPELSELEIAEIVSRPYRVGSPDGRWTLSGFLHWFNPDYRPWFWWDANTPDSNSLIVQIVVDGCPYAWGALRFLLKAAGAVNADENE